MNRQLRHLGRMTVCDNLPTALRKQWVAAQQVRDRFDGLAAGDVTA